MLVGHSPSLKDVVVLLRSSGPGLVRLVPLVLVRLLLDERLLVLGGHSFAADPGELASVDSHGISPLSGR
jgi:hypothetical protein